MAYDRYKKFINNGKWMRIPFIKIPKLLTDKYEYYQVGKTRFDLLSYQYYSDPNYGWLIMQANPQYDALEFMIPPNARIRIPYPLDSALQAYEDGIEQYSNLYGLE